MQSAICTYQYLQPADSIKNDDAAEYRSRKEGLDQGAEKRIEREEIEFEIDTRLVSVVFRSQMGLG
jgi:hypothetical protein